MPRVSVVIPARNAEPFIAEALQGVGRQTLRDWEVILVDDGSSDGTVEAARRSGVPFRLLQGRRAGPGAARNLGLTACGGEWVAFLDADDLWEPEKLEVQLAAGARGERGAVYSDVWLIEQGRPDLRKRASASLPEGWIAEAILRDPGLIVTSSLIFRRSLWASVGPFDETSPVAEDWEWFVRLACRTQMAAVREPLVRYRLHPGNTHRRLDLNARHGLRMLDRALESYAASGRPVPLELRDQVHFVHHRTYALGYLFSWRSWRAVPHLLRALHRRPLEPSLYLYLAASLLPGRLLRRLQRWRGRPC